MAGFTIALMLLLGALAAAPVEAAKPRRGIVSEIREIGQSDRFLIKGRFKQPYRRGEIIVQQRFNNGRWTAYSRERSTSTSRYRIRVQKRGVTGDIVCYRLTVPSDGTYRRATVLKASRGRYAGKRFCIETTFG